MPEIQPFNFHGNQVRVVMVDGDPWWVAVDVCQVLEIKDARQAAARLDQEDRCQTTVLDARGVAQDTWAVNESGLYELIFRSDKPQAREFRRWVTSEVLPQIRRTGSYQIEQSQPEDEVKAIASRAHAQLEFLRLTDGLVDPKWLEGKVRHLAARVLGEEPEIEPENRPLTVGDYLEDHGIKGAEARRVQSKFGRLVKGSYIAEHGEDPPKVDRFVDGAVRKVFGYTEADRHLFDAAYNTLFAY